MSAPAHIQTAYRMSVATYNAIDAVMHEDLQTPEERSEFLAAFLVNLLVYMSMRAGVDKVRELTINATDVAATVAGEVIARREEAN